MYSNLQPEFQRVLRFHGDTICNIVFNPNDKQLVSGSNDNTLLIWDLLNPNSRPKKLEGHKSLVNDIAVSSHGTLLASASSDHTVRLWANTDAPVKSVDFSCDDKLIVTGSDDKTVKVIALSDRKVVLNLASHTNWVKSVRFSPDSKLIGSGSDDRTVKIWDVSKKTCIYTYNDYGGVVNVVRFHPDNSTIASGSFDKKIRLHDLRSKQLIQLYDDHKKSISGLSIHPTGYYLASTSFDETVKIWDLRKGELMYTLTGHDGPTTCVNFSKYGDYLATGGQDSVALLWKSNMITTKKQFYDNYEDGIMNNRNSVEIDYKKNKLVYSVFAHDSKPEENLSEELCKFFEKMVYQFEIITASFSDFEKRLSKIEDLVEELKTENVDIELLTQSMKKLSVEREFMEQLKNNIFNNNMYKDL